MQTILPLSCSRILTAALVPVLYLFGPAKFNLIDWNQLAIVMSAYMINATTSCGPSPLGGGGMMAEGQMRAESGYIRGAYSFGAMAIMAPIAAIYMKFLNLSIFSPDDPELVINLWTIGGYVVAIVVLNIVIIKVMSSFLTKDIVRNWGFQLAGFLVMGAIAGAVLSLSLYGINIVFIIQGLIGGIIASLIIALMMPKSLVPVKKEELYPAPGLVRE